MKTEPSPELKAILQQLVNAGLSQRELEEVLDLVEVSKALRAPANSERAKNRFKQAVGE